MVASNSKTRALITRWEQQASGHVRLAAGAPPFPPSQPPKHSVAEGLDDKREIPAEHPFDPRALKPMARMLWATSVSLGHALAAFKEFNRMKSSTVSPDGMLGGRGYIMSVKDVRQRLYEACEALSAISDTIHDEIHGPHWKARLAELPPHDSEDVDRFVEDAERILEDPEGSAEEEADEIEEENDGGGKNNRSWLHPALRKDKGKPNGQSSEVPDGGDVETAPRSNSNPFQTHYNDGGASSQKTASQKSGYDRRANSSIPVETEPGGPRVQHLDRADSDQTGPYGAIEDNQLDSLPGDGWSETDGVGEGTPDDATFYQEFQQTSWSNDLKWSASGVPDANSDPTPTQGYDFGIGFGDGNDAHGQGVGGYGNGNPSSGSNGVWGPSAELPSDPGAPMHDHETSDTTPIIEQSIGHRLAWLAEEAVGKLPNDGEDPVARSDYYQGEKGNLVNAEGSKLPGEEVPQTSTPSTARPSHNQEHMFADSGLPGDQGAGGTYNYNRDLGPDMTDTVEQVSEPYIKWDDDTHQMRPDYQYQRGPMTAPYVKDGL